MRSVLLLLCLHVCQAQSDPVAFFESKVRPVLAGNCYACHSARATISFAGLRLDSRAGLLKGGDHGPAIVPGKPDESRLVSAIRYQSIQMPPTGKLPQEQIDAIVRWIEMGAPWPDEKLVAASVAAPVKSNHRAWQPVRRDFPAATTIDSLIRSSGIPPSPRADRRTLMRRISYDLTGLPPGVDHGASYTEAVDRLLASPHFGERWGRFWLDLARFSDAGFNNVRFPFAHTYRDWVIEAYNSDLPYDQFILNQIAADLLQASKHLPALGFLSLGFDPHRPNGIPEKIDDRIDTVSRSFLGLTVSCARCHDHKYDPIPTSEYYSLYGVFLNTRELLVPGPIGRSDALPQRVQRRLDQLAAYKTERIAEYRADAREPATLARYKQAVQEARGMAAPQMDNLAKERNLNHYLLKRWVAKASGLWNDDPTDIPLEDFAEVQTEGDYNTTNNLLWQYKRMLADDAWRGAPARAMSVEDAPHISPAHVLVRGNMNDPGDVAPRQFLKILGSRPFTHGSGRLDLARAIADPGNPLTARVYVNRVWQHLFGEGLIRTPSDFGTRGEPPTHPELLDYLAHTFIQDGWSTKKLIRRILLSETYRQSSADNSAARKKDPENRLLWRMNRRRLDFESLRDSMLVAAGTLDRTIGGPSFSLQSIPADPRRTLYAFVERERAQAVLKSFNYADPEQHTAQRHNTTVPQQALFLLNSPFLAEQARRLAERSKDIDALFRNALGRAPTPQERRLFVGGGEAPRRLKPTLPAWSYGAASLDTKAGRVSIFRPFRYFAESAWQPGSLRPHRAEGAVYLTATGGAPGDNLDHAVVRRWTAPVNSNVNIRATLTLPLDQFEQRFGYTNGIRGWIVHSRLGVLGSWTLAHSVTKETVNRDQSLKVQTNLDNIDVAMGDDIDFIVDSLDDYESDDFTWAPVLEAKHGSRWSAAEDFHGPHPQPLSSWEQLAQVILLSNEFAFLD